MTQRGRGCLEVKPSSNPFFQTTSSDIGVDPNKEINWKIDGQVAPFNAKPYNVDGNFSFLYTRTSDDIGSKVKKPIVNETRLLSKTEFLRKKREELHDNAVDIEIDSSESIKKNTAEDILKVYKHNPKQEDPRYTTSTSEYGKKAPSIATIVVERNARSQDFSKSFNSVKPQNTSLTTAITKSTVHKSLDPQFA